jgi:hypothetical protein
MLTIIPSITVNLPSVTAKPPSYRHTVRDGTVATLTLPEFDCAWSRKPSRSIAGEYFAWRDRCIAQFAKETGLRIAVVTPGT